MKKNPLLNFVYQYTSCIVDLVSAFLSVISFTLVNPNWDVHYRFWFLKKFMLKGV